MLLQYTSPDNTTIQATLDDGESLGNHAGPATIFVPCDPANKDFQAIVESGEPIAPYEPPPEAPPVPDANARITAGATAAVQTYNAAEMPPAVEPAAQPGGLPEVDARLARLETTFWAWVDGQMAPTAAFRRE